MKTLIVDGINYRYDFKVEDDLVTLRVINDNREDLEVVDEITFNKDLLNEDC